MQMNEVSYQIHGFAIVSENDCIADGRGVVPEALRNEADWTYFQNWLDRAALSVLGRLSHEANPNIHRRRRLIVSGSARGLERRADGLWWNPGEVSVSEALHVAAPEGGIVAVPGGRSVFDLFLFRGFQAFHLSRAAGVVLKGGVPVFSGLDSCCDARRHLVRAGLHPRPTRLLDPVGHVSLTVFEHRPGTGRHGGFALIAKRRLHFLLHIADILQ